MSSGMDVGRAPFMATARLQSPPPPKQLMTTTTQASTNCRTWSINWLQQKDRFVTSTV